MQCPYNLIRKLEEVSAVLSITLFNQSGTVFEEDVQSTVDPRVTEPFNVLGQPR